MKKSSVGYGLDSNDSRYGPVLPSAIRESTLFAIDDNIITILLHARTHIHIYEWLKNTFPAQARANNCVMSVEEQQFSTVDIYVASDTLNITETPGTRMK